MKNKVVIGGLTGLLFLCEVGFAQSHSKTTKLVESLNSNCSLSLQQQSVNPLVVSDQNSESEVIPSAPLALSSPRGETGLVGRALKSVLTPINFFMAKKTKITGKTVTDLGGLFMAKLGVVEGEKFFQQNSKVVEEFDTGVGALINAEVIINKIKSLNLDPMSESIVLEAISKDRSFSWVAADVAKRLIDTAKLDQILPSGDSSVRMIYLDPVLYGSSWELNPAVKITNFYEGHRIGDRIKARLAQLLVNPSAELTENYYVMPEMFVAGRGTSNFILDILSRSSKPSHVVLDVPGSESEAAEALVEKIAQIIAESNRTVQRALPGQTTPRKALPAAEEL